MALVDRILAFDPNPHIERQVSSGLPVVLNEPAEVVVVEGQQRANRVGSTGRYT